MLVRQKHVLNEWATAEDPTAGRVGKFKWAFSRHFNLFSRPQTRSQHVFFPGWTGERRHSWSSGCPSKSRALATSSGAMSKNPCAVDGSATLWMDELEGMATSNASASLIGYVRGNTQDSESQQPAHQASPFAFSFTRKSVDPFHEIMADCAAE